MTYRYPDGQPVKIGDKVKIAGIKDTDDRMVVSRKRGYLFALHPDGTLVTTSPDQCTLLRRVGDTRTA